MFVCVYMYVCEEYVVVSLACSCRARNRPVSSDFVDFVRFRRFCPIPSDFVRFCRKVGKNRRKDFHLYTYLARRRGVLTFCQVCFVCFCFFVFVASEHFATYHIGSTERGLWAGLTYGGVAVFDVFSVS